MEKKNVRLSVYILSFSLYLALQVATYQHWYTTSKKSMSYEIIKLYYYLEILSAAILRSTSTGTSVHHIFSFAAKGG